ncbi:hypothetical protein BDV97DRAFT_395918 [Delphinella strobiligena]|nr:hypothetical protein BDV97DRAFT_395918 [Delphinella strobiligena]
MPDYRHPRYNTSVKAALPSRTVDLLPVIASCLVHSVNVGDTAPSSVDMAKVLDIVSKRSKSWLQKHRATQRRTQKIMIRARRIEVPPTQHDIGTLPQLPLPVFSSPLATASRPGPPSAFRTAFSTRRIGRRRVAFLVDVVVKPFNKHSPPSSVRDQPTTDKDI